MAHLGRDEDGVWRGCHTDGVLPGGLEVERRAAGASPADASPRRRRPREADDWIAAIRHPQTYRFPQVLKWVSAFALAVNEENANLGRVVTAPTNGAAGVIPAVLMYHVCFSEEPVARGRHRRLPDGRGRGRDVL